MRLFIFFIIFMLEIKKTSKQTIPKLPYEKIKNKVLGEKYNLSLVFIGDKLSQKLNKQYRKKDKITNVLSFSLTKNEGEIFINLFRAKTEASYFSYSLKDFIAFLLIHSLVHLKGFKHSGRMDREEQKIRDFFNIKQTS